MRLVTAAQMRVLEQQTVDAGATWSDLMEQAGWGVAQEALRRVGVVAGKHVLVLVGPGNNGGDGLVVARHLHDAGATVTLYVWRRQNAGQDANWLGCRGRSIAEQRAADDPDQSRLRQLLAQSALVVDALLGIGVNRTLADDLAAIVVAVNDEGRKTNDEQTGHPSSFVFRPSSPCVLSVDVPSGVDSDTGAVWGGAVRADVTVATGAIKHGLLRYPARIHAGAIVVADIGLTQIQLETVMSEQITAEYVRGVLPARPDDSHKGTYGKAMIVAGSVLYPGAASLATAAAARVGAGLVTLASGRSTLGGPGRIPEITLRPLPEAEWGVLGEEAAVELLKHIADYAVILVGPGLGREKPTRSFVERLLGIEALRQRSNIGFRLGASGAKASEHEQHELPPLVIDADGLNLLSEIEHWHERLPHGRCVLTPHPGEMKRLLGTESLPDDLTQAAEDAARTWGQIVVLKGATTVVADPEGRSFVHAGGNAALATAGTGDVLAGAIAGLVAQGVALRDAAVAGVYLHSVAGQLVREELGDAGALASDLLLRLPLAIKQVKR